jgi:hypothetical protein
MEDFERTCPFCKADLLHTTNGVEYSRLIGIEIQGQYDGVLAWMCPYCKAVWDRWVDKPSGIATHQLRRIEVSPMYPGATWPK